jgi:predicted permease
MPPISFPAMFSTLLIVLPIFALIFTGWLVRRMGIMGPQAAGELNRFVVYPPRIIH